MEEVESTGRNDESLSSNQWRENENRIIKQEMYCMCPRRDGHNWNSKQKYMFVEGKKNYNATKKENVSNIFKLQNFKRKSFSVLY
jgi:hypothetical protein